MKTPKERKLQCAECKSVFTSYHARAKYCTKQCSNKVRIRIAKEVKIKGIETGILFGRPVQYTYYDRYKKSAISKGIEFNLTKEQFSLLWKMPCFYCKTPIQTIGIDRKDSAKGYTEDNITPCCTKCNLMKRHISVEDFINHCKLIANSN